jgi:putative protease
MHNHTPAKVAFLEQVGLRRAILARELCLDEIRAIRQAAPAIELECFVHGALCVCYSGQCSLSYALGGRSGNRGQCAQPCRKPYRLLDAGGRVLAERSHLLSLRDLNLSEHLPALLDAGVTSFKIEGRLKDLPYVANLVAHYRTHLDAALGGSGFPRNSSGTYHVGFTPDPDKTFNRGYTAYFLHGRTEAIAFPPTPKMVGEEVGRVKRVVRGELAIATRLALHPGDGLCFDAQGELRGTQVNAAQGADRRQARRVFGRYPAVPNPTTFFADVRRARLDRRIAVTLTLRDTPTGVILVARDEDGVEVARELSGRPEPAKDPEAALATIRRQLLKTGSTIYACSEVVVETAAIPFLPVSVLNGLRRDVLDALTAAREERRPRVKGAVAVTDVPYPEQELSYLGNVMNAKAETFYRRHGVVRIESAAESGLDLRGRQVMTTRYCLKHQLGLCPTRGAAESLAEPLFLVDDEGNRLRLHFDCTRCEMEIVLDEA